MQHLHLVPPSQTSDGHEGQHQRRPRAQARHADAGHQDDSRYGGGVCDLRDRGHLLADDGGADEAEHTGPDHSLRQHLHHGQRLRAGLREEKLLEGTDRIL